MRHVFIPKLVFSPGPRPIWFAFGRELWPFLGVCFEIFWIHADTASLARLKGIHLFLPGLRQCWESLSVE